MCRRYWNLLVPDNHKLRYVRFYIIAVIIFSGDMIPINSGRKYSSGFIADMQGKHELVPLVWASGGAGGYVTSDAFERIVKEAKTSFVFLEDRRARDELLDLLHREDLGVLRVLADAHGDMNDAVLRAKLDDPPVINTVRGGGYRIGDSR